MILEGDSAEADLAREAASLETVGAEAQQAGAGFIEGASAQLESLIARLANRHTGWFTRCRYELLFGGMLGWMLYRLGKNFFYDSWLGSEPLLGLDFYLECGFWLILWCLLLIWAFAGRLRRGLRRQLAELAEGWKDPSAAAGIFVELEDDCRRVEQFRQELDQIEQYVGRLRSQLALPDEQLGHRRQ